MSISSLAYIVVETANTEGWSTFLQQTVGLACSAFGPSEGLSFRMDNNAWRIHLQPGDTERFLSAGLECAGDRQLDAIVERIVRAGMEAAEDQTLARARGVDRLVLTADPCGNAIELVVGRALGYEQFVSPAGVSAFVADDMGLGHVVLPAPDIEAAKAFWLEIIGLGLTDRMSFTLSETTGAQRLYFMHADNARHHSVALFEAPSPSGLVHVMVEAATIDDVGRFIDRCERDKVSVISEFGRHSNDRMLSIYVMTPGNFMMEFGCDGMRIDWQNWVPTHSLVPDLWGHKFVGMPGTPAI